MVLEKRPYSCPFSKGTLRDILTFFVETEAESYNQRDSETALMYMSEKEIGEQALQGKVGFGSVYREKKADPALAAANALSCFEDGLIRVLLNERELRSLDEETDINEGDVFTFIRLTFLTGRMW